jgi:hypothetical protein
MATITAWAPSQPQPPRTTSMSMNGAASGSAISATDSATVAMRTAKSLCTGDRRREDQVELGA